MEYKLTVATRRFGWGNAVFGQMMMELAERKPELLKETFQRRHRDSRGHDGSAVTG
jgi:hypothetical protein